MYLQLESRNAVAAREQRKAIRRRGETYTRQKLWTNEEDRTCRRFYPDYARMMSELPHRSYWGIRCRCQKLGIQSKRRRWTAADVSLLRKMYPTATCSELEAAFGVPMKKVRRMADYFGFKRKKPQYAESGNRAIDAIRERCRELGYTMVDLDELAGSKQYFQHAGWQRGWISHRAIGRAIMALDGVMNIEWSPLE